MNQLASTAAGAVVPGFSIIIPVTRRTTDLRRVLNLYRLVLDPFKPAEVIFVISHFDLSQTRDLADAGVRTIRVPDHFREASCIREGVRQAAASHVLVLPPYLQVTPASLPAMLAEAASADLIIAARDRRRESMRNRLRGHVFRSMARIASSRFSDLGCIVAFGRREVFEEVAPQDSQYTFLPVLAERVGFSVVEVGMVQAESDLDYRAHGLPAYSGRLLDVLSVAFLIQFLQKPFRFFGSIGAGLVATGICTELVLLFQRSAQQTPMGDRPALLLGVLLVVLGLQVAAVGLIAEVVLFTRLPADANYRVREIVERDEATTAEPEPA